jgi:heterodisulfide reductase subunit A-like polyferredoxin
MALGEVLEAGVIVIGGGVAGMNAALVLAQQGVQVMMVEKENELGGRLLRSNVTFPDMAPAAQIVQELVLKVQAEERIAVFLSSPVHDIEKGTGFSVEIERNAGKCMQRRVVHATAIVLATGMSAIDPAMMPELGYGRAKNVITAEELEDMLRSGKIIRPSDGAPAKAVAFVQCVGSRVEKRGVPYCSAVCCANAIKDAITLKGSDHAMDVYVLYIDIRTCGKGQEALYKQARATGVRFIRGQPSMVVKRPGSERVLVCGENTLLKELYEIPADLVVLSCGLTISREDRELLQALGVEFTPEGLIATRSLQGVETSVPGVFVAGALEAPKDVKYATSQGAEAGAVAAAYVKRALGEAR